MELQDNHVLAREHQYTQLSKIQNWVGVQGDIFDTILVYENYPLGEALSHKNWILNVGNTKINEEKNYLLTIVVTTLQDRLTIDFNFNDQLIDGTFIGLIKGHFHHVVEQLIGRNLQTLKEVQVLTEGEKEELLRTFNETATEYPQDKSMVDLFEERAKLVPENTALICGENEYSYRTLNRMTNRLANYLRTQCYVKPGDIVGIMMDRSEWAIVSILGILKTGASYVPIDVDFPQDRKAFIIEDTQLEVLIIDSDRLFEVTEFPVQAVAVDIQFETFDDHDEFSSLARPNDLAYVIYTSGSTGQPKGVLIEHTSNVNMALDQIREFGITETDGILQFASLSFDASVYEIFMALYSGATLVIADKTKINAPDRFISYLREKSVSVVTLPPTYLGILDLDQLEFLRVMITAGEAANVANASYCAQFLDYYNAYGPTECAVCVSTYRVKPEDRHRMQMPIGRPVSNTQLYVLDPERKLVPKGVIGELYVGGAGLARGYLNRDDLTQERFVANPFSSGELLYRTGDLAKWLPDGNLEFHGRTDNQVKIRGHRIELGEIEAVLLKSPLVNQAIVLVKEEAPGQKNLVGYVIPAEGFDKAELIEHLHLHLPKYMIPGYILDLPSFPLNTSGKVDKNALMTMTMGPSETSGYKAPRTELEDQLTRIWSDLLGGAKVSIEDNFFELGGDSIITIQLVSRIKALGYQLRPKDIFENPTIARIAEVIEEQSRSLQTEQGLLEGPAELAPIQQWFLDQEFSEMSHYNQTVLLSLSKGVTEADLANAISHLQKEHDALRFNYSKEGGEWTQHYGVQESVLEIVDLSQNNTEDFFANLTDLCADYQKSLNIESGILVRAVLFRTPGFVPEDRLLIVIHHLAVDAVSWRIMLNRLDEWIEILSTGNAPELLPKTSSYREWVMALKNFAASKRVREQLDFWKKISEVPTDLPTDFAVERTPTFGETDRYTVELDEKSTTRLLQEANLAYNTQTDDILWSGLAKALTDFTGRAQIVIGREGHGRDDLFSSVDTSETVGWFTNLHPVALDLSTVNGDVGLIKSVKEQLRAIPDNGIGFGLLRYLNPPEQAHGGLEEVKWDLVFNYLGQLDNINSTAKWFSMAAEDVGPSISGAYPRPAKIIIDSMVTDGKLKIIWNFSTLQYRKATIERLADSFLLNLERLIQHCVGNEKGHFTPSDFGLGDSVSYRELDEFLDEAEPVLVPHQEEVPRRERVSAVYGLSPLQKGMLFHGLYDSSSKAYNNLLSADFPSDIDVEAFTTAWNLVLQKHSILRSSFFYDKFQIPVQAVYEKVQIPIEISDLTDLSSSAQSERIEEIIQRESELAFDFTRPPLIRIKLLKTGAEFYKMLLSHHHIIWDGWSAQIIIGEFLSSYVKLLQGESPDLGQEDQYIDHINYIRSKDHFEVEKYWKNYLGDIAAPSLLPFSSQRENRNQGGGRTEKESLVFNRSTTREIADFCKQQKITVNTLTQGIWSFLLAQYTGNQDVIFGVTVSGRPTDLAGAEKRVGLYINTIPLRTRVDNDKEFLEWFTELQGEQLLSREYQYGALNDIKNWSDLDGDIFDSIMVFENFPRAESTAKLLHRFAENFAVHENQLTNYLLTIVVILEDELTVHFNYNSELLKREHVEMFRKHFEHILWQIVRREETAVGQASLLTAEEELTLADFCTSESNARSVNELWFDRFAEVVEGYRDDKALVFQNQFVTYGQFDESANQFAGYLHKQGVRAGDLVVLCIENPLELVQAMWGVLRAGAAFVPIDPVWPEERIAYILNDTRSPWLIVDDQFPIGTFGAGNRKALLIEECRRAAASEPTTAFSVELKPDDLMYVIYTSGSTGKPKGVMVTHGNLTDYIFSLTGQLAFNPGDRFALLSTLSADLGNTVLFGSLLSGGQLHLFTKDSWSDPSEIHAYFDKHRIDGVKIVPSHWNAMEYDSSPLLPAKVIIFGGDVLSPKIVQEIQKVKPELQIVNHYGPTETTIGKLLHKVPADFAGDVVPIGRPFGTTRLFVVNEHMQLCPVGVTGELLIGGKGVAKGYLNREALTAKRFIANPFHAEYSDVLYRTGDLVRLLPDGNIVFEGRADDQVKIRGYRVEPGEIESIISEQEGVVRSIVLAKADPAGNKRLIAYVHTGASFDLQRLKQTLENQLPNYMQPSFIMALDSFPLNANGKIDRQRLPDPEPTQAQGDTQGPRNQIEADLVTIWTSLLSVENIGIHDNFFELGGDSIITIQVISRVKKAGYVLRPRDIFEFPTIAALAKVVRVKEEEQKAVSEQGLLTGSSGLLPIQQRFLAQEHESISHYNQSMLVSVSKRQKPEHLEKAFRALLEQHDALRFEYRKTEVGWEQHYSNRLEHMQIIDLSELPATEVGPAITKHCDVFQRSLDIGKGEVVRCAYFKTPTEIGQDRVFLVVHHLAVDMVSWRLLLEQFSESLQQLANGSTLQFEKKGTSYRQWVSALEKYATTEEVVSQLPFWEQAKDAYTALPTDQESLVNNREDANIHTITFSTEKTTALLQEIHQTYQTEIDDILLSALLRTVANWSGRNELVVGLEGHGREDLFPGIDISNTVGWFTNLYPVLLAEGAEPSTKNLIRNVKEQLRMVPAKGIGFGLLSHLHPSAEIRGKLAGTTWDIVFNYLGQLDNMAEEGSGLRVATEPTGDGAGAKYPMPAKWVVVGAIKEGKLTITWTYSCKQYQTETIREIASAFKENLEDIIHHCQATSEKGLTPSDFDLAGEISIDEFDAIFGNDKAEEEVILNF